MFCYNCGKENSDNSKFCYNCGKELLHLTTVAKLVPNTNNGITGKNNIEKELQETKCTESDETTLIKPNFIKQILIPLVIVGIFVWLCNVFVSKKDNTIQTPQHDTNALNQFKWDPSEFEHKSTITEADRLRYVQDKVKSGHGETMSLSEKLGKE